MRPPTALLCRSSVLSRPRPEHGALRDARTTGTPTRRPEFSSAFGGRARSSQPRVSNACGIWGNGFLATQSRRKSTRSRLRRRRQSPRRSWLSPDQTCGVGGRVSCIVYLLGVCVALARHRRRECSTLANRALAIRLLCDHHHRLRAIESEHRDRGIICVRAR